MPNIGDRVKWINRDNCGTYGGIVDVRGRSPGEECILVLDEKDPIGHVICLDDKGRKSRHGYCITEDGNVWIKVIRTKEQLIEDKLLLEREEWFLKNKNFNRLRFL